METRQVTEYRVFILNLANVHGGVDKSIAVAAFDNLETLKEFYKSQLAEEPWKDDDGGTDVYGNKRIWRKDFKKGSILEWYNPISPENFGVVNYQDAGFGGVTEEWWGAVPCQENCKVPFNPMP